VQLAPGLLVADRRFKFVIGKSLGGLEVDNLLVAVNRREPEPVRKCNRPARGLRVGKHAVLEARVDPNPVPEVPVVPGNIVGKEADRPVLVYAADRVAVEAVPVVSTGYRAVLVLLDAVEAKVEVRA